MRELLVCTNCRLAIFVDSVAHKAPRWTGRVGDPLEKRKEIGGRDDLQEFKRTHRGKNHEIIEAELDS